MFGQNQGGGASLIKNLHNVVQCVFVTSRKTDLDKALDLERA